MNTFADFEMSDWELSEMLAVWEGPDPPAHLRERVFPKRKFAFDTSAPLGRTWYQPLNSGAISAGAHIAAIALLLLIFQTRAVQEKMHQRFNPIYLSDWKPKLSAAKAGGGGGGQRTPEPAAQGAAPQFAPKQFLPPTQAVPEPKLPSAPTITAQAPQISADLYGDPLSRMLGASPGLGVNGFGSGSGGGVGLGNGTGYGPGSGGGMGGGVYQIGGEVSQPVLINKIEPEYSEEARKAKYSGTVLLSVIIDANGTPRDIRVIRPLGLGLDEKAIEAVGKWRFRPAMKAGHAVAVQAQVEVNFRLL